MQNTKGYAPVEERFKDWLADVKTKHGDLYDYSKVNFTNAHSKVTIICKKHGDFIQSARSHKSGSGCPTCYEERLSKPRPISAEELMPFANKHISIEKVLPRNDKNGHTHLKLKCDKHKTTFIKDLAKFKNREQCPACSQDAKGGMCYVYFMEIGHRLYKIGMTANLRDTLVRFRNQSSFKEASYAVILESNQRGWGYLLKHDLLFIHRKTPLNFFNARVPAEVRKIKEGESFIKQHVTRFIGNNLFNDYIRLIDNTAAIDKVNRSTYA